MEKQKEVMLVIAKYVMRCIFEYQRQELLHELNFLTVRHSPPPQSLEQIFKEKYESEMLNELQNINNSNDD